jgi:hypothetical protein
MIEKGDILRSGEVQRWSSDAITHDLMIRNDGLKSLKKGK